MTELRPRGAAWTREPSSLFLGSRSSLVDQLQDLLAIRLPFLAKVSFQILLMVYFWHGPGPVAAACGCAWFISARPDKTKVACGRVVAESSSGTQAALVHGFA